MIKTLNMYCGETIERIWNIYIFNETDFWWILNLNVGRIEMEISGSENREIEMQFIYNFIYLMNFGWW